MKPADDTRRNPDISNLLEEQIKAGDFPSAVYLVGEKDATIFTDALGHSAVEPYRITNKLDTIYDLASLTSHLLPACFAHVESSSAN